MNARSAARELALLTLFQLDRQGSGSINAAALQKESLREMVLAAIRALSAEAESQIQEAANELAAVSRSLIQYEMEHEDNLNTPLEADIKPVAIPNTREMIEKIERCLQGAEFLFEAMRIPELLTLMNQDKVQDYARQLMVSAVENQPELDEMLNKNMQDWRMDRLMKLDAYILRIATAEMRYVPGVDLGVSINEAVDLAKKFSGEESYRLINGVLGAVARELSEQTGKSLPAELVQQQPVP